MRRALAGCALLALGGCAMVDPAAAYREAARQLRFSLERVEPKIELAFPLEDSRLRLRFEVGVQNDSSLRLHARGLRGMLAFETDGALRNLGEVALPAGFDVESKGRATVPLDLSLTYRDLASVRKPLLEVVERRRPATWRLDGTANLEALGFEFDVPIHASKHTGP